MKNCNFDERQLQKRGTAFKIGFFTLLIENMVVLFLYAFLYDDPTQIQKLPFTPATCIMLEIFIAVAVFGYYCVWNDCYFPPNESRKWLTILFTVIGCLNIILSISHFADGTFLEDGSLSTPFISLIGGILLLLFAVLILVKSFREKKDEEER